MRLQICLISKFSSKLLSDAPPRVCYRNRNNLEKGSCSPQPSTDGDDLPLQMEHTTLHFIGVSGDSISA